MACRERAIALDPSLAEAHALLGDAHRLIALYGLTTARRPEDVSPIVGQNPSPQAHIERHHLSLQAAPAPTAVSSTDLSAMERQSMAQV